MLECTSSFLRRTIEQEEAQCAFNRHVYTQVHHVLDEMVYDVEICEHECQVETLKHQLETAESLLVEYQERENELIQERQQAYEYAVRVEQEGRMVMSKVNDHLSVIVTELGKKEAIETELQEAKEQLQVTGHLAKELTSAQREIRELRRAHEMQSLLRRHNSVPAKPVTETTRPMHEDQTNAPVRSTPISDTLPRGGYQGENLFSPIPDHVMLKLFSFLDTESMVAISVTDRVLVHRVNVMFGVVTPSNLARSGPPPRAPNPSPLPRKQSLIRSLGLIGSSEKDKLSKVDAIVKSLKPDQMKLFLDMSTKVKLVNSHLTQLQTENEDISARLYSAENVRDFLMEKLKFVEAALASSMTNAAKKDEQAAMDREIIGFLDAKTQEYETALKEYALQNNELRKELVQLEESHASKIRIIEDMVTLLTEEKTELEAQVRAQRKVLVREVKALRAQTQRLATERDHYLAQLKHLKHALRHLDELS